VGIKAFDVLDDDFLVDAVGMSAAEVKNLRAFVAAKTSGAAISAERFLVGSGLEKYAPKLDDFGFASASTGAGIKAFDLLDNDFLADAVGMSPAEVKNLRAFVAAKTSEAVGVANVPRQAVEPSTDSHLGSSI